MRSSIAFHFCRSSLALVPFLFALACGKATEPTGNAPTPSAPSQAEGFTKDKARALVTPSISVPASSAA